MREFDGFRSIGGAAMISPRVFLPAAGRQPHPMARIVAPFRDAASETSAEPARHRALRGKAGHLGDLGERTRAFVDQAQHDPGAFVVEDLRERGVASGEAAVNGAPVAAEMLGDALYRTVSARQQHANEQGDPGIPSVILRLEYLDAVFEESGELGRSARNAAVQIGCGTDDSVKVGVKQHVAAEELPVKAPAARRSVSEMNFKRPP